LKCRYHSMHVLGTHSQRTQQMSTPLDQDIHRSIEPTTRYLISALFGLVAVTLAVFNIAGKATQWIEPARELWLVVLACALVALVPYVMPLRERKTDLIRTNTSVRPGDSEASKYAYELRDSFKFYTNISDVYDARLTREYFKTLRLAGDAILGGKDLQADAFRILDIGAGTGQFMRHLQHAKNLKWTCLEPNHEMATILRKLFDGEPVFPEIHEALLEDCASYVELQSFQAVTLNSVLSSMPTMPDFGKIAALLSPGGILVVSDGHPDIRNASPSFRVRNGTGVHELAIAHRSPSEVSHAVLSSGSFESHDQLREVTKQGRLYSYVLSFRKKT
jgi:SAM-dependent methyltransferase